MIELIDITKTFDAANTSHDALIDVTLTIEDGDIFGIIGISGAGKSTLARCINLLERPSAGTIRIDDVDITNFTGRDLLDLRSSIGMIFQDFSLFSQRTVLQNVMFPLEIRGDSRQHCRARAYELLEVVGLVEKANSYPSQLSGGQQQRVSIARALANDPKIILCDEATSALDTLTTNSILDLLRQINRDLGVTIVVITHSMSVVRKICNKVAVLDQGRVIELGTTEEIFDDPQNAVTSELIGEVIIRG
ncbi:MAG: ATP-binding cassette domain-containing protein [Coriobacteriia bacterium]|nr:ATP-binding cassette domain-containing protein [Coriobacteriia bacterium]